MFIAADIGGTKTNIGIFDPGGSPIRPVFEQTYLSTKFPSVEALVSTFLESIPFGDMVEGIEGGCLALAGPIVNDSCVTYHLPWVISRNILQDALGWDQLLLLNDLEATC